MQDEPKQPEGGSPIPMDFIPTRESEPAPPARPEEPKRGPGRFLAFLLLLSIAISALAFYLGLNDETQVPPTHSDEPYQGPENHARPEMIPETNQTPEESLYREQAVVEPEPLTVPKVPEVPEVPEVDDSASEPAITIAANEEETAEKAEEKVAEKPQELEPETTAPPEKPPPKETGRKDSPKSTEAKLIKSARLAPTTERVLSIEMLAAPRRTSFLPDFSEDDITEGLEAMETPAGPEIPESQEMSEGQGLDGRPATEGQPRVLPKVDVEGLLDRLYAKAEPPTVKVVKTPPPKPEVKLPPEVRPPEVRPEDQWWVQIASLTGRERALAEHKRQKGKLPELLEGRDHRLVMVDLGNMGIFHRLQVGRFADESAARGFCARVKGAGGSCIVVKP